ncbi:MAG: energy transducer TonB [Novosphingobium sp.]
MNILKSLINFAPVLVAGAFLFSPPAFGKSEPVSLERTGKWVADYDVDSCHLTAAFGQSDDPTFVMFTRYEPGDALYFEGLGRRFNVGSTSSPVRTDFGPVKGGQEHTAMSGNRGKLPMIMLGPVDLLDRPRPKDVTVTLPPITAQDEIAATYLTVAILGRKPLRLETGSMAAPMRAMRACMDDLVKHWGLDPLVQARLSRKAIPFGSPGSWLRSSDYPAGMLSQGGQGIVQFRLDVDETGAISGCHIQQRTNPDEFADLSCKLVTKRGKFTPALDSNGQPVKSYFVSGVRWIIDN